MLPWIPVPCKERQQQQESRAKPIACNSSCTFERSPGYSVGGFRYRTYNRKQCTLNRKRLSHRTLKLSFLSTIIRFSKKIVGRTLHSRYFIMISLQVIGHSLDYMCLLSAYQMAKTDSPLDDVRKQNGERVQ